MRVFNFAIGAFGAALFVTGAQANALVTSSNIFYSGGSINTYSDITFDSIATPNAYDAGNPSIHVGVVPGSITSSIGPVTLLGNGLIVNNAPGTANGISATPAGDATNYLSILGGHYVTLVLPSQQTNFGLLWGSIDNYNEIRFFLGDGVVATYFGDTLNAQPPVGSNGDQSSANTNSYIKFAGLPSFNKVMLSSSGNSFELDNISFGDELRAPPLTPGIPEPSTWAMMIIGFVGIAIAGFRRRMTVAATRV